MSVSRRPAAALALTLVVLIGAGCGGGTDEGSSAPKTGSGATDAPKQSAAAGKDLPKPLAANRSQANEILGEGSLDAELAKLEGFPVVVNQWASWCDPCRAELPYFAEVADARAGKIAFLGIDMQDSRAAAEQFLAEVPLPFPSVFDPDKAAIRALGGGVVSPTTVFIDQRGEIVNVFQGSYESREQLEQDIERYLMS